jgi:hypothetical protein
MSDTLHTAESVSSDPPRTNFLDVIYGSLFQPLSTFQRIAQPEKADNTHVFYALLVVLLISSSTPLVRMMNIGGDPSDLTLGIPTSALLGALAWSAIALTIGLLAYAFTGKTRIQTFLTLSGLATLPWLLLGPISLFKLGLGSVGFVLATTLSLGVWLWAVILFAIAIMVTYQMSVDRVLIILIMPWAMSLVFFAWIAGFASNISQLAPPS